MPIESQLRDPSEAKEARNSIDDLGRPDATGDRARHNSNPFAFRSGNGEGAARFIAAIHHGISAGRPLGTVNHVLGKSVWVASPFQTAKGPMPAVGPHLRGHPHPVE